MKTSVPVIGGMVLCVMLTALFSGCDAFKSWFEKTAEDTVIAPIEQASMTKLKSDLRTIVRSIEVFHAQQGRYPDSLEELARLGALQHIPREPFGGTWVYDRHSGKVKSSTYPEIAAE